MTLLYWESGRAFWTFSLAVCQFPAIVGVSFSRTGNAWLAYIKNRLTKMQVNRYFKVTVYGFKLAKKKAIEARLELEKQLRSQSGWEAFSDRKSRRCRVSRHEEFGRFPLADPRPSVVTLMCQATGLQVEFGPCLS